MYLNDDPQQRVAKNPMQCAQICPLIFQELESRSCRGHKVMISATALTVNFWVFAAGEPTIKLWHSEPGFYMRFHPQRWHLDRCLRTGSRATCVGVWLHDASSWSVR